MYPLSPVKANVGHLYEKLKTGMKSGLKQRCGGNFLAIFAGTVLSEKTNLQEDFLSGEGRSILAQIKGRSRKRPQPAHKAPQCGAFRGFETAV